MTKRKQPNLSVSRALAPTALLGDIRRLIDDTRTWSAEVFPDLEIVQALTGQLSWTHFTKIIYLYDQLKRDFYAEMCRIERWSTRTLEKKIRSLLFEGGTA